MHNFSKNAMNSDKEKLSAMESFRDELVFFVNGKKVCGNILIFHSRESTSALSFSKSRLFWIDVIICNIHLLQILERNPEPEMTLLTYLRRKCIHM